MTDSQTNDGQKMPIVTRNVDEYSQMMRHELPTKNPLASFAPKPKSTYFDQQAESEKVLLLLRAHPITLLKPAAILLAGILFPLLLINSPILEFVKWNIQFGMLLAWILFLIGFSLEVFLVWFFNVYIITDERIIDVDFLNIVYRHMSSAQIEKIEDVSTSTTGVFASMFNFGNVFIQTAAEKNEFMFENVPFPEKVATFINELIVKEEAEHQGNID